MITSLKIFSENTTPIHTCVLPFITSNILRLFM